MEAFNNLYDTILARRADPQEGSYTNYLFAQGTDKVLKKLGEECAECIIAAKNEDRAELTAELCDLAFHAAVLMAQLGITPDEIAAELNRRAAKTGNLKAMKQVDKDT
ncbi:MAG: phosphoribosyl-ATP diphosphatase [Oscillospiraceae bacterium]|nr:phosphoribosyl-ATP diphosphatase [Oscillospiraceae bacterium]